MQGLIPTVPVDVCVRSNGEFRERRARKVEGFLYLKVKQQKFIPVKHLSSKDLRTLYTQLFKAQNILVRQLVLL